MVFRGTPKSSRFISECLWRLWEKWGILTFQLILFAFWAL